MDEQVQAGNAYFTPEIPRDANSEAEAEGKRRWVQIYYVTLYNGLNTVAELDTTPVLSRDYDLDYLYVGWSGSGVVAGLADPNPYGMPASSSKSRSAGTSGSKWPGDI